ncbi:MAG: hypothetical protein JWM35_826 [Verrucomicrobia bacterium]|nr:hypothetical protein [Verrucomicrobiota bacterium]
MAKGAKIGVLVAVVALAAAGGAFYFIRQTNRAPSPGVVKAQVESLVRAPGLQVTKVVPTITPATPGQATVTFDAEAQVTEALYEIADGAAILRDELKLDPVAWQKTRKTLSGKTAPRILELSGLKNVDQTLLLTTFLRETTAKGALLTYNGSLRATKIDAGWQFVSDKLVRTSGEQRGKPRTSFAGKTTVVSDVSELQSLRMLAAAQTDLPAKVDVGRQAFLRERQAEQDKVIAQLLDAIKPGTVYAGTYKPGSDPPAKVFIEFTNVSPSSKKVTAWLRNDGSWSDKRALSGAFAFDPDDETLAVTLDSAARQALHQAGPAVGEEDAMRIVFQLSGDRLAAHDARREFELSRLTDAAAAAAQKQIEAPAVALRDATAAGKIYRGTVRAREGAIDFDYLLRFNQEDSEAGTVVASVEPAGREAWRRTYRGTMVVNRYRGVDAPLHLESRVDEAVRGADVHSPAGLKSDSALSFQFADGHLRGEGDGFTYDFAPLSAADVAKLEAATAEREKGQLAIVKTGVAYPGVAHWELKGTSEKVRLRFRRVDAHGANVEAVIESLERPGIMRELRGALDTFEKRLVLTTTGKGRANAGSRAGLKFPAFVRSGELILSIDVGADALNGAVRDQAWNLNFPVAGAVAISAAEAGDYPTESGAYVWSGASWQSLPRNSPKLNKGALQVIGGLFSALSKSSSANSDKVGDLSFTGSDPVPSVDGKSILIIYVGRVRSSDRNYPAMEMAATNRESDGSRKVTLYRIAPSSSVGGFREHRIAASLDRVSDSVLEMSCSRPLPAGTYAISVNDESFELNVE